MEQQMGEPQKPFACSLPDCGMTFTNEDHLNVHTKKHDMVLQLGMEQKAAFVADQTPTPTRFIRNCEEVGLFQDLHVNPFDEGFKRAMETKAGMLSLDSAMADDLLHTPQMVFPLTDADSTLFTSTNNQKNITISRSSSDETGAVKEYETTTISKLTNEVTTISRVIEKQDAVTNEDFIKHDEAKETSVSYTNNIIKIHSNVEIRKDQLLDANKALPVIISYTDTLTKDTNVKDSLTIDKLNVPEKLPPIMSQKSIDFVVDSLVNETLNIEQKPTTVKKNNKITEDNITEAKDVNTEDFEVIIKLPNKKYIKMKPVDELMEQPKTPTVTEKDNPKEKLKNILQNKANKAQNHIPGLPKLNTELVLPTGTLYPVTIVNTPGQILLTNNLKSIPIPISRNANKINDTKINKISNSVKRVAYKIALPKNTSGVKHEPGTSHKDIGNDAKFHLERRSAASKRYRARLKQTTELQKDENEKLKQSNKTLKAENAALKYIIVEHLKVCPSSSNLSNINEVLQQTMKQILEDNEVL